MSPGDQVRCYHFVDRQALYLYANGDRVIADFQGPGQLESLETNLLTTYHVDGQESTQFPGPFRSYLAVAVRGEGEVHCRIRNTALPDPAAGSLLVSLPYHGSGWLVDGSVRADQFHQAADCLPTPFFERLDGVGHATIIPGDLVATPLMQLSIDDPASFDACGFEVQNMSRPSLLASTFADGTTRAALVASHLNRATWTIDLPPESCGLLLRKTYDRFHGLQRARVLLDGQMLGWWFEPDQNRTSRWAVAQAGFDVSRTGTVRLSIDPPPGTPLWSFSTMSVFALRKQKLGSSGGTGELNT